MSDTSYALIATPEDYAECRRIMFGASKNYAFASRLLPRRILRQVEALYALWLAVPAKPARAAV